MRERGSFDARAEAHARIVLARGTDRAELEAVLARFSERDPVTAARAALALVDGALARGSAAALGSALEALLPSLDGALARDARLALARIARRAGALEAARAHLDALEESVEALVERAHLDRQQSRHDDALATVRARALARARARRPGGDVRRARRARPHAAEPRAPPRGPRHARRGHRARAKARPARARGPRALASTRARRTAGAPARSAIPLHEEALALHEERGDRRLAAAEARAPRVLSPRGGAHSRTRSASTALRSRGSPTPATSSSSTSSGCCLARLLVERGRVAEARLELGLARELGAALKMPRLDLTHHLVAGLADAREGRLEEAAARWREGAALGPLVEVGFEALLPAWLALAEGDPSGLDPGRVGAIEHPGLRVAYAHLAARAASVAPPPLDDATLARSCDARLALALSGDAPRAARGGLRRAPRAPAGRNRRRPLAPQRAAPHPRRARGRARGHSPARRSRARRPRRGGLARRAHARRRREQAPPHRDLDPAQRGSRGGPPHSRRGLPPRSLRRAPRRSDP